MFEHVERLRITPLGDNLTHQLKRLFHIQTRHDLFSKNCRNQIISNHDEDDENHEDIAVVVVVVVLAVFSKC